MHDQFDVMPLWRTLHSCTLFQSSQNNAFRAVVMNVVISSHCSMVDWGWGQGLTFFRKQLNCVCYEEWINAFTCSTLVDILFVCCHFKAFVKNNILMMMSSLVGSKKTNNIENTRTCTRTRTLTRTLTRTRTGTGTHTGTWTRPLF